ncbi:MAG: glycosyltransferase family 2 protein [Deltaproteobacteria bacterium]|nr:glycosyltransferase family 2 protein [Deltaproteobacteria bacterium]
MPRNVRHILPRVASQRREKLTAVIPAFEEAGNIASVVRELQSLSKRNSKIDFVVVDDGSSDGTRELAIAAGARVISHPYNMGIGVTVQTGFRHALAHGAQYVVQVDGDGQHIPDEIEKLLPPLIAGTADVVVGTRFAKGQGEGLQTTTFMRWLAGRALSLTIHFLTGSRISDTTSGFRVFNREAAEYIANNYPDDYPEVQILVNLARRGFRIVEVPVRMRSRTAGASSINWWRAIYYVFKVMFSSFMDKVRR